MMRQFLIIAAFSAVALSACSQQKKATSTPSTNNTTAATTATVSSAAAVAQEDAGRTTYVKMERTPCFGHCPFYSLEFYDNGLVRYTGKGDTELEGAYEKQMDPKKIREVLQKFDYYRVDTCKAKYEPMITDVPGLNFWISRGDDKNEIRYANFGPDFLPALAGEMDAAAKPDKTWKRVTNITD